MVKVAYFTIITYTNQHIYRLDKGSSMLMSRPRTVSSHSEVANVHNYYERLVTESILKTDARSISDADFLADVSCVALNHLPPRYIRHDVDMSFFMSPVEREETEDKVQRAVDYALIFVKQHEEDQQEVTSDDIITDAVDSEEDMENTITEEKKPSKITTSTSEENVQQDTEGSSVAAEVETEKELTTTDISMPPETKTTAQVVIGQTPNNQSDEQSNL